ncbi:galactose ABC transporter substrate-binding protein [Clostridium beijerinckii]|uniref:D-galactose/methyl-galactoside binding periplasmic protein MglB n=1 Tax=Clostridium beijerinckii TaxID=1520 RepID=A0A1S9N4I2_CLOBE|nr:galactose ABC transporter substrate-binding protein [Clostridium beijerinckii]MZK53945.1 substrate-binding domain-containing protein [Clostridium beijerinckii]MZK62049.1 substrate-binding domain-containing protein [Clostridium beijerinckii]MZK72242.1 substrate-binding domain-containing protein [Clostridium beijerinckii]MZK77661.1 substrate-binding domain-containing protein [Clostridium beijerinckii]MZK87213.1 substrate-binding domain-containing protein [Clostridium beijerinckii]
MNVLKKLKLFIIIVLLLSNIIPNNTYALQNGNNQPQLKVAVFINNFEDLFLYEVKKNLEDIQTENAGKVQFTFFDAKENQSIQNESIENALNQDFNLFVIRPVSKNLSDIEGTFNKIQQKNIPLIILYEKTPSIVSLLRPYRNRSIIINTDLAQSGTLEGKILANAWNSNKGVLDKNKDNIMQYVLIKGPSDSNITAIRNKYSIQAINESGIKTQEISSVTCDFLEECARTSVESLFLNYSNKIEAIIANSDSMAIGAVKGLQKYGYNKGDPSKYIPVVGVDALPEAQELIAKGFMTGTVKQDPREHANAIYSIGMNLVSGAPPLSGTNYKFDETGVAIELPYSEYVK